MAGSADHLFNIRPPPSLLGSLGVFMRENNGCSWWKKKYVCGSSLISHTKLVWTNKAHGGLSFESILVTVFTVG